MRRLLLLTLVGCQPPADACEDPAVSTSTSTATTSGTTTTSEAESTTEGTSSTEGSTSTGEGPECNENGACDAGEDVEKCPEECNECGDGVVVAPEECDNGTNEDAGYTAEAPGGEACAAGCVAVEYCGDGEKNGPEACDDGGEQTAGCEAGCEAVRCGDGVVNEEAGESCDDGNEDDGDGCSGECVEERRVFASSGSFEGDLNYAEDNPELRTGLALADARCKGLAEAAGQAGEYKAWLSDSEDSPATRFDTAYTGHYRLLSAGNPVVATGWADLTDGTLAHAINADETGALTEKNVLTNTAPDGTIASDQHCSGWTANDDTSTTIGKSSATDATWTSLGESFCSDARRIYCVEDP